MSAPILNKVRDRMLFLSPTVQAAWEPESKITDFDEQKLLGQGAFGVVKKVAHKKTNIVYAIKIVQKAMLKQTNMVEQMINEVKIMYSLNHPYILKLYNHFEDDQNLYLILEFAPTGQLYAALWKQPTKRFNEKVSAKFILQLTLSLEHIHYRNIIHRDIKPENLLLDEQVNIKLADFGWSNFMKPDQVRQTFCGTLDYLAPEMLDRQHKHDQTVDIWSIGVLLFELLTGMSPFAPRDQQNNQQYVEKTTKENIRLVKFSYPKDFPENAQTLINGILMKDPKQRLTCEQIRQNQWIVDNTKDVKIPASITMELEKKKIIQNTEIDNLQKEGKVAFTVEEIYQYSRPDSIIVKDHYQAKNEDKLTAVNQKVKNLESKLMDQDIDNKKKQAEIESLKSQIDVLKSSGNVNENTVQFQQKLKMADERYMQQKLRYDNEVQKNMDYERKIKELENQNSEVNDLKEKVAQYKQKNKDQRDEIEKLKQDKFKGGNDMDFMKGAGNVDDLLSELKKKHGQEMDITKYK